MRLNNIADGINVETNVLMVGDIAESPDLRPPIPRSGFSGCVLRTGRDHVDSCRARRLTAPMVVRKYGINIKSHRRL